MQVRTRCQTRATDLAHDVAPLHPLTDPDGRTRQVRVTRAVPVSVLDLNESSVSRFSTGEHHPTFACRYDRAAITRRYVDARVRTPIAEQGVQTIVAEPRTDPRTLVEHGINGGASAEQVLLRRHGVGRFGQAAGQELGPTKQLIQVHGQRPRRAGQLGRESVERTACLAVQRGATDSDRVQFLIQ